MPPEKEEKGPTNEDTVILLGICRASIHTRLNLLWPLKTFSRLQQKSEQITKIFIDFENFLDRKAINVGKIAEVGVRTGYMAQWSHFT